MSPYQNRHLQNFTRRIYEPGLKSIKSTLSEAFETFYSKLWYIFRILGVHTNTKMSLYQNLSDLNVLAESAGSAKISHHKGKLEHWTCIGASPCYILVLIGVTTNAKMSPYQNLSDLNVLAESAGSAKISHHKGKFEHWTCIGSSPCYILVLIGVTTNAKMSPY